MVLYLIIQIRYGENMSQSKDIRDVENLVSNVQTEILEKEPNVGKESSDKEVFKKNLK